MFVSRATEVNLWQAADIRVEGLAFVAGDLEDGLPSSSLVAKGEFLPGPGRRILTLSEIENGRDVGEIRLRGEVHMLGPVIQLSRSLPRNHLVRGRDLKVGRGDISIYGPGTITTLSDAVGKRLRIARRAGTVLAARDLLVVPLIRRGERVGIVAKVKGIRVKVAGVSREDGQRGELVRVKNLMSRRMLMARVVDQNTVAAVY